MLRPQDNVAREAKRLDGLWAFALDPAGAGCDEGWWRGPLVDARLLPVPASYNDVVVDPAVHDHVGDVWYQRAVQVPRGWAGERVVLRFDAATHRATVWLDDEHVAEHEGSYTPFEADVTSIVRPGQVHRLTVVVNNELSWQSIPPGIVQVDADGSRKQHYYHDFFNYAGLHRSVWLHATPVVHVDDITVVTDIDGTMGVIRCTTSVAGAGATTPTVRAILRDAGGTTVARRPAPRPSYASPKPSSGSRVAATCTSSRSISSMAMPSSIATASPSETGGCINASPTQSAFVHHENAGLMENDPQPAMGDAGGSSFRDG